MKEASRRDFEKACKGLVLKSRKQAHVALKRHAKRLVVKSWKQADVTSKRHAKGLSSNRGSMQLRL